jgi:hypothetical protein
VFAKNENGDIYHVTEDTRKTYERDFKTELIIRYDEQLLKERSMNYEIYKSEVPFTGIEIRTSTNALTDSCCGFVLMRNNTQDKNQSVINFTSNRDELDSVYVGIDFGSTNTTITQSNLKGGHNNIILQIVDDLFLVRKIQIIMYMHYQTSYSFSKMIGSYAA